MSWRNWDGEPEASHLPFAEGLTDTNCRPTRLDTVIHHDDEMRGWGMQRQCRNVGGGGELQEG